MSELFRSTLVFPQREGNLTMGAKVQDAASQVFNKPAEVGAEHGRDKEQIW